MTKYQLKARIVSETVIRKSIVSDVVDKVFDIIAEEMNHNRKVSIDNFGVFTTSEVKARTMRNLVNGDSIEIPAHKKVNFKASKALKERINE